MRLIDADAAIEAAIEAVDYFDGAYDSGRCANIREAIGQLPTMEPAKEPIIVRMTWFTTMDEIEKWEKKLKEQDDRIIVIPPGMEVVYPLKQEVKQLTKPEDDWMEYTE